MRRGKLVPMFTLRTSRRRTSKKGSRRRTSRGRTDAVVRRGSIRCPGFSAKEYRGGNAQFRGRIEVRRGGAGFVEYPSPSQIARIAREEGISADQVRMAFGHMRGGGSLRKNAKHVVRKGELAKGGLEAVESTSSEPYLAGRILVDRGAGMAEAMTFSQLARVAPEFGITAAEMDRAFGHMRGVDPVKHEPLISRPRMYGSARRIKLGHIGADGVIRGGVQRGQLILFDGLTNEIIWGLEDMPDSKTTRKIRNIKTSRAVTFETAMENAEKHGVPVHALVQAFGHHLDAERRREILRMVSKPKGTRRSR